jgi:hypothetical protein
MGAAAAESKSHVAEPAKSIGVDFRAATADYVDTATNAGTDGCDEEGIAGPNGGIEATVSHPIDTPLNILADSHALNVFMLSNHLNSNRK